MPVPLQEPHRPVAWQMLQERPVMLCPVPLHCAHFPLECGSHSRQPPLSPRRSHGGISIYACSIQPETIQCPINVNLKLASMSGQKPERGASGAPRSGLCSLTAVRAEAIGRWPEFREEADFFLEARKKSLLHGRGCIFSRSPIVKVVAFRLVFGAVLMVPPAT